MTTKIYSKFDENQLLHMIVWHMPSGRINLCNDDQFLQCASLRLDKGTTFKPHSHLYHRGKDSVIAQESWFIVKGSVLFMFYDRDGELIGQHIVKAGQATFTFAGGHNYEILEDDTVVMEYKTGPYLGQENDKKFL